MATATSLRLIHLFIAVLLPAGIARAAEDYSLGPDSQEQAGVPRGEVKEFAWKASNIYPGTERRCWIYLPPGFDAAREYPLMVFQDGGGMVSLEGDFRTPVVLDNLIHRQAIPPMVALFIDPGNVPAVTPLGKGLSTRSFEYDTPDSTYARFLIEEMLPAVARYAKISANPEDRAVVGTSSGGICAFTAAWFRPDAFRKVITGIGSFTNIRGGFWYPAAIRKTERKPLRVFLQDGEKDLDNVHGSWPLGAHELAAALAFAGYDHKAVFGDGGHSGRQLGSLFPEALRWLWRKDAVLPPPAPEAGGDLALSGLLIPGKDWQVVVDDKKFLDAACSDAAGNFYFSDLDGGTGIYKVAIDGTVKVFNAKAAGITGMKFGPDGRLYACQNHEKRVIAIDSSGAVEVLASDIDCNDLAVDHKGRIYVTETSRKRVLLIEGGKSRVVATSIEAPNGLALSPDQEVLAVSDFAGNAAWAFRVEANGDLRAGMPVMPYRHFGNAVESSGDGMTCDTRGRWYCSTLTGVQVFDPNGRPIGLIPSPSGGRIISVALSGPGSNWLFTLTEGRVYKRQVNAVGFVTSQPPIARQ
jgi:enterochelin esterase family protein